MFQVELQTSVVQHLDLATLYIVYSGLHFLVQYNGNDHHAN